MSIPFDFSDTDQWSDDTLDLLVVLATQEKERRWMRLREKTLMEANMQTPEDTKREWSADLGTVYRGDIVTYKGKKYSVAANHSTMDLLTPDTSPTLYAEITD